MNIHAEVTYVTDEVKIGLHKEPSNESPIIKLVPSGTKLNVIEYTVLSCLRMYKKHPKFERD